MKAMVCDHYGPPDVLRLVEMPTPVPRPGEVLIKVHAAGVNPVDWKLRSGMLKMVMPLKFPKILGVDLCGEIAGMGDNVHGFHLGDRVFGMADMRGQGSYAEYVCTPAHFVSPAPTTATDIEAASLPVAALTALQSLVDKAGIKKDEHVLVIGASGGVGMFAVQIAQSRGAHVTAACSSANGQFAARLGAEKLIAYDKESYDNQGPFHVIIDTVGALPFFQAKDILLKRGRYVCPAPSGSNMVSLLLGPTLPLFSGGRRSFTVMVKANSGDLEHIAHLVDTQALSTCVEQTYPLEEVAQAHARSASHRVVGKLVLRMV